MKKILLVLCLILGFSWLTADAYNSKINDAGYFGGIRLAGRVKVVNSFPDIRVKIVDYAPDLRVKLVKYSPIDVGEWQLVDYGEDFTVMFVDYAEDIRIQFVDYAPGVY